MGIALADGIRIVKLLTQYETESEADIASMRLEHKGIATFVSSRRPMGFPLGSVGPPMIGLWVVLDDQFDDASALLFNPDHEVTHALSFDEIETIKQGIQGGDQSAALGALGWLGTGIFVFVFFVYLLTGLE